MAAGRPTKYTPALLKKAEGYIKSVGKDLPSIEDLAIYLDIRRSTIYEWKEIHEDFSDILDRILAEQAKRLLNNGLSGKWNPTISKLVLGKHGYSDKAETDITSGGKPIPILASMHVPIDDSNPKDSSAQEAD